MFIFKYLVLRLLTLILLAIHGVTMTFPIQAVTAIATIAVVILDEVNDVRRS